MHHTYRCTVSTYRCIDRCIYMWGCRLGALAINLNCPQISEVCYTHERPATTDSTSEVCYTHERLATHRQYVWGVLHSWETCHSQTVRLRCATLMRGLPLTDSTSEVCYTHERPATLAGSTSEVCYTHERPATLADSTSDLFILSEYTH